MIGLSMGLAMIVGVASFSVIYSLLDPLTDDFVTKSNNATTARQPVARSTTAAGSAQEQEQEQEQETTSGDSADEVSFMSVAGPTAPGTNNEGRTIPTPTRDVETFEPDYRISSRRNINLRAGPGTNYEVVIVLPPGAPLQSLGETAATSNPGRDGLPSGGLWRQFRTENGDEGWIRDVDVDPLNR
jgi:hypothetical protein